MELQEVVNTWQEAQDCKDRDTASSSVSIHTAGEQSFFSEFFAVKPRRQSRDKFVLR